MADKWYKLDNVGTMIPATASGANTRVFRISCTLNEDISADTLQAALDMTCLEFPHLNVTLRKGLFWYYLDPVRRTPVVEEDHLPVCSAIYYPGRRTLLYRVSWFHNRINLEMFHVLADGTGAFTFLKQLVSNYLCLVHGIDPQSVVEDRSSAAEKDVDAFSHFYEKTTGNAQLDEITTKRAYQVKGNPDENLQMHVLEGIISAKEFIELSHRFKTTAGVLSGALIIQSIVEQMSVADRRLPVIIQVPVNLRQYFPSETTRNFFGVIIVRFDPHEYDGTLESIIPCVRSAFEKQLTPENISRTMNSYSALEHNPLISIVPLFLKDPVIRWYFSQATKGITATVSNLGRIRMPKELAGYIDYFVPLMSARNLQICISTYDDRMVFGAVSAFTDHRVMLTLFRKLKEFGIKAVIATNDFDQMPVHGV